MARTPIAARQTIDPVFSDGCESNHCGEMVENILDESEFQSPIDLTSRTTTLIKFKDAVPNALAEIPRAIRHLAEPESQLRVVLAIIKYLEKQVCSLQKVILAIADIPQGGGMSSRESGEDSDARIYSSGAQVPEELRRTELLNLCSQQIVAPTTTIQSLDMNEAPPTVTADRRVEISKYCAIVTTSTEIAKKFCVSNKDKTFESLDMLDKALRASNLLSLVDESRKKPVYTEFNKSGYIAEGIVNTIDADGMPSYVVIAEDDCYKYYAESIIAFTFMVSMINKDMYHMLIEPIREEDPVKIYKVIQEHFKGVKNHHVEAARKKLYAHRLGPDIERDLSELLELISDLEFAQKMVMSEHEKFAILRVLMTYENRFYVRLVVGIASYNKESFNFTIKKMEEEWVWDALPAYKSEAPMAASMAPASIDRICFKFQTNECTRIRCPFIHKIMSKQEKKDQKYDSERPGVRETNTNRSLNNNNGDEKFKGKKDTRNDNSQGINGMHINMPLTKEYQLQRGAGQSKPTANNPNGYSKKQIAILDFLFKKDSENNIRNVNEVGNFSSWGGEMNSCAHIRNDKYKKDTSFNIFNILNIEVYADDLMILSSSAWTAVWFLKEVIHSNLPTSSSTSKKSFI